MVNAAIIGLGRWGQLLVDSVYRCSNKIKFVAGVTRTPTRVQTFCKDRSIELHDQYQSLLIDSSIDAVVLATPHSLHFDQILAAANSGKHVFCEKPFCLDRASAAKAIEIIQNAGLVCAVGHNRRFAPNTIELKHQIDSGELTQDEATMWNTVFTKGLGEFFYRNEMEPVVHFSTPLEVTSCVSSSGVEN